MSSATEWHYARRNYATHAAQIGDWVQVPNRWTKVKDMADLPMARVVGHDSYNDDILILSDTRIVNRYDTVIAIYNDATAYGGL